MTTAPIACTLTPGEYADRLRWIADLNRAALRAHARQGLALVLTYAPTAADRVRELVEREARCCAFLTFRLDESPDATRLTVHAPEEVTRLGPDASDALFVPFLAGIGTPPADATVDTRSADAELRGDVPGQRAARLPADSE